MKYTAFMKMYSTITNLMEYTKVQTGFPDNFSIDNSNETELIEAYPNPMKKVAITIAIKKILG